MSQDRKELSERLRIFLKICMFNHNKSLQEILKMAQSEDEHIQKELLSFPVIDLLSLCFQIYSEVCRELVDLYKQEPEIKPTTLATKSSSR